MPISSTPTFRSLSQMVGEMVASFLSNLDSKGIVPGIQSLKPGSPYLAIFESTGQSQFRNQEQTLSVLDANDLDIAHGDRLDRIGIAENLPRRAATFASGRVNISDTRFTKIATKVYQGRAAPIPGSIIVYVADASAFSPTGNLYIGRGTPNLEGPLAYTLITNAGAYWTITLSAPTSNFHGLGEVVTFAQGGNRSISAGQVVQTPQGNQGTAAEFVTTSSATILDGETLVSNVPISSRSPGTVGNASAGGIKVVVSPAFIGAAVTNPLAITNGLDVENDDLYRERIKASRRARAGVGTTLGLSVYSYGVEAPDEPATVISSQYVNRSLLPSLLVIDDGTGYEAKDAGIAFEVVMDSAAGGEDIFFLNHGQPVAKANVTTIQAAPFALSDQATLTVVIGGITYTHTFVIASFADITNATAYEVVASINSNPVVPFSARTVGAGTYVAIFAKDDVNDSVEVIATPAGTDANVALRFPVGKVDSLRLYKNDILLSKDGNPATLDSTNQSTWSSTSSGETLIISVDGTPYQTYTIEDADFIALGLGYTVVSSTLPLSAWAAVFNAKVPGITCSISGSFLVFTSNMGSSARAAISIDPSSSLVMRGFFNPLTLTAQGRSKDYVLDRNLGQIDLTKALVAGDRLTAGTPYTRAYLQSTTLPGTINIPAGGSNFFFVVDGDAVHVPHKLNASHTMTVDVTVDHRTYSAFVGIAGPDAFPFTNVRVGDMAIWAEDPWAASPCPVWDSLTTFTASALASFGGIAYLSLQNGNLNHQPLPITTVDTWWTPIAPTMMRVSSVDPLGHWFRCDFPTAAGLPPFSTGYVSPEFQKLFFVRTDAVPQQVFVPTGVYSQAALTAAFNIRGATAAVISSKLRVTTNTFKTTGDIALVAQNINALALGFLVGSAIQNDEPETAAVESGNSEIGTGSTVNSITITSQAGLYVGNAMASGAPDGYIQGGFFLRTPDTLSDTFWGGNAGDTVNWLGVTPTTVLLDHLVDPPVPNQDLLASISRFRVGPLGVLNLAFDNDPVTKGFSIPMTRWMKVAFVVPYSQTIRLLDGDNLDISLQPQSLALAFGTNFDFSNFVLHAHARARFDLSATQGGTDVLLVRLKSWNGRDTQARAYILPSLAPATPLNVLNVAPYGHVAVYLASAAARAVTFPTSNRLLAGQTAPATDATVLSAFYLTSIARAGTTVTVQLARPNTDITTSGLAGGMTVFVTTSDVNFPSGPKTIVSASTTVFTNDTITYTEAGAAIVGSTAGAWVSRDSIPIDFTAVQPLDVFAFPVSYWGATDAFTTTARLQVLSKDAASPAYWVRFSPTTLTSPGWVSIALPSDFTFFPLANNLTSQVAADINALATSSVTATFVSGGDSPIVNVQNAMVSAKLADGTLHIASAVYNSAPGVLNYDITLKLIPDVTLTATPNDWTNEEFRLAPSTAKNVSDFLNRGQVTGLASTGASIQASSRGRKVQLASGTLGSAGAAQVSGGTANALFATVLSAAAYSSSFIMVSTPTTNSLEAVSTHVQAMLNNAQVMPKVLNWTSATTLTAAAGKVTVGGAGSAWHFDPIAPTFGTKWLFTRVGRYMYATPYVNVVNPAAAGNWVHFEPGYGKWTRGSNRNTAVTGATYAILNDGRVLSIGGSSLGYSMVGIVPTTTVEAYDPVAKTWYVMTSLPAARVFGAACTLADGRVFFCGGISGVGSWHNDAAIFDPTAGVPGLDGRPVGAWTVTSNTMAVNRSHHTATLMSTGQVVVAGGATSATATTNTVDIYTPGTDLFTPTNNMAHSRAGHLAFLFGVDQVLVIGGHGAGGAAIGYESYTLSTGLWNNDNAFGFAESRIGHAAVQLSPNTFMVLGGAGNQGSVDATTWTNLRATCEIYDVSLHTVTSVASMAIPRAGFGVALLSNNKVVAYSGLAALPIILPGPPATIAPQRSAEVFNIATNEWSFASGAIYPQVLVRPLVVSGLTIYTDGGFSGGLPQNTTESFDASVLAAPAGNNGTFRVLNSGTDHLMFEASAGADAESEFGYVAFYTYNSTMPSDILHFSSAVGTAPKSNFGVLGIDLYDPTVFSIDPTQTFATGVLSTLLPLVSIVESVPARMLYDVAAIFADDLNAGQSLLALEPFENIESFNASAGSALTFQDKLNFPTALVPGQDGYRYNTGLIAEVTKVIYGDERDSVTYPGYAAAGAAIDVSAPLIRRVTISLAVRATSGAVDVTSRVQSAVAKVINSAPPGPIAISLITEAVMAVDGITSVVMLSPVATTAADTIPVQPYEKALVLDPVNDVRVSTIGP